MFRLHLVVGLVCLFGCLFVVFGCQKKPGGGDAGPLPDNLATAALQTHIQYIKAVNSGAQKPSDEIAKKYWTDEIKRLKPIRLYRHRGNIVVVQRASTNWEEGLYISIMISSYAPQSGDDGFTFSDIGNSVYDFKRVIGN
ncbi:MAG TPA: hypothetical protein VMW72_24395 [Sedimentisphaerales bacterium]|nr:hypothetical protein [Sedimentisphaerales bacterium]